MSDFLISPGVKQVTHDRLRDRENSDAHPQYSLTSHSHDPDTRGVLGYATATASDSALTDADLALSVSVTVAAGRVVRVTYHDPNVSGSSAGDDFEFSIEQDGVAVQSGVFGIPSANDHNRSFMLPSPPLTLAAGSYTFVAHVARTSGAGTITCGRTATQVGSLLVEDLGAA